MIAEAETHFVTPEEIMAYLDGELTGERAESVAAHMQHCLHCQEMSGVLRGAFQTLAAWTVEPAAADSSFELRLSEMAAKTPPAKGSFDRFRSSVFAGPRSFFGRALGAMACVALVFFMASITFRRHSATVREIADPAAPHAQRMKPLLLQPSPAATSSDELSASGQHVEALGEAKTQYESVLRRIQQNQISSSLENSAPERAQPERESQPMIAHTVGLSIVVKDFGFSRTALDAILARHHGYAATLAANTQQDTARSVQASLRIPAAELSATVTELKLLGHVENETQAGEEVTQQHADLVARLKNSRETEQRLQAILLQRTGKIGDVLAVEQEIARVRGEIEQMEAEQKSLEHRVDFATIDLSLAEEYKAQIGSPSPSISTRFHNAAIAGFRAAVESAVGVVLFIAEDGPVAVLWLVFLAPVAWFLRRRWIRSTSLVS